MGRWIRFLIAIAIGVAAGLFYGWRVNPAGTPDSTPDTLRIDYRTDFVLMTAEAYSLEMDLPSAQRRLALLGDQPLDTVREAILFAETHGYVDYDLGLMRALSKALEAPAPPTAPSRTIAPETGAPAQTPTGAAGP